MARQIGRAPIELLEKSLYKNPVTFVGGYNGTAYAVVGRRVGWLYQVQMVFIAVDGKLPLRGEGRAENIAAEGKLGGIDPHLSQQGGSQVTLIHHAVHHAMFFNSSPNPYHGDGSHPDIARGACIVVCDAVVGDYHH